MRAAKIGSLDHTVLYYWNGEISYIVSKVYSVV